VFGFIPRVESVAHTMLCGFPTAEEKKGGCDCGGRRYYRGGKVSLEDARGKKRGQERRGKGRQGHEMTTVQQQCNNRVTTV
jgi:hypothetical protein